MRPSLTHEFADLFPELSHPWRPTLGRTPTPMAPDDTGKAGQAVARPALPRLVAANAALARELGIDEEWLRGDEALAVLSGREVLPDSMPVAQAYSGHQFGGFSPVLGDGRAVLLGELRDTAGSLRDIALKGSGRTVFSRGGDGRAVLGSVLRELLFGEAMHALGIPSTRALAAIDTGDHVWRDNGGRQPGAVLVRIAASHVRIGTVQYAAAMLPESGRADVLTRLVGYALHRHHPRQPQPPSGLAPSTMRKDPGSGADPGRAAAARLNAESGADHGGAGAGATSGLQLLRAVTLAQADLVAQWTSVGFLHGVMNTDNMALSGETIDYGPCAWLETYREDAVFSSIDTGGRYRFGNQPAAAVWNLARLAEALLPILGPDQDAAVAASTEIIDGFMPRFHQRWRELMARKLGLTAATQGADARGVGLAPGDAALADDLLAILAESQVDYTLAWRGLAEDLRAGTPSRIEALRASWWPRWLTRLGDADRAEVADAMDAVNPLYVPRNHLVEAALNAATAGDLGPFGALLDAVSHPYAARPGFEELAAPAPGGFTETHVTYCGT